ncbi:aminotransferase class V-fold PLP-dependent enzyme [Oxalobacteraceae bacterium A2-2]
MNIYLDSNATSPVLPAAMAAAMDTMGQRYGNPSSTHSMGLQAREVLERARQAARRVLGADTGELMFNSGATEGIQTAVLSALCAVRERRARGEPAGELLLYGATEHKAVPEALAHWNRLLGLDLPLCAIPVDADGCHDLAALRALAPRAAMVCTMAANNETGVISDLDGIAAVLAECGSRALWMVDCVQALGKLPLQLGASRIDYAPFSGHKLYAPKGVGMLYVRAGAPYTPLVMGGGQEGGLRSGTENMAGIAALGAVLEALESGQVFASHATLESYRQRIAASLRAALPEVRFNQPAQGCLPTTLNFSVPGLSSSELMDVFDAAGISLSAGSACSAAKAKPSAVLDAMGLPEWRSSASIRLSFGALIDDATVDAACACIARCGAALRTAGMLPGGAPVAAHDGVVQIGPDGACAWLLLDAASSACVVIDARPELVDGITATIKRHGCRVLAVLGTAPGAALAGLPAVLPDTAASIDAYGWPQAGASITLEDGASADCLHLGAQVLACVQRDGQRAYLLGKADGKRLPSAGVRHAFAATLREFQAGRDWLAGVAGDAVLCASRDHTITVCTSVRALAQPAAAAPRPEAAVLDAAALDHFLRVHPDAMLVDVREPHEHAAAPWGMLHGRPVHSVPLSQLAGQAAHWLRTEPAPLLFFCRSGKRSSRATQCLRSLGYGQAYSLGGAMALASVPPAA